MLGKLSLVVASINMGTLAAVQVLRGPRLPDDLIIALCAAPVWENFFIRVAMPLNFKVLVAWLLCWQVIGWAVGLLPTIPAGASAMQLYAWTWVTLFNMIILPTSMLGPTIVLHKIKARVARAA